MLSTNNIDLNKKKLDNWINSLSFPGQHDEFNEGNFIYIECQQQVNKLNEILLSFKHDKIDNEEFIQKITIFFRERWERIKKTDAIYTNRPETIINKVCFEIASYLAKKTGLNNPYLYLMPDISMDYYDSEFNKKSLGDRKPWEFILADDDKTPVLLYETLTSPMNKRENYNFKTFYKIREGKVYYYLYDVEDGSIIDKNKRIDNDKMKFAIVNKCKIFLMAKSDFIKESNPNELFLYRDKGSLFYKMKGSNDCSYIDIGNIKNIHEQLFDQQDENPVFCKDENFCQEILNITMKRGHTQFLKLSYYPMGAELSNRFKYHSGEVKQYCDHLEGLAFYPERIKTIRQEILDNPQSIGKSPQENYSGYPQSDKKLLDNIIDNLKSFNEFISMVEPYSKLEWEKHGLIIGNLSDDGLVKLIELMHNGEFKATKLVDCIDFISKKPIPFSKDESRARIEMLLLLEAYKRKRQNEATYNSTSAQLTSTAFTKVGLGWLLPKMSISNREQKVKSVEFLMQYITSQKPIGEFYNYVKQNNFYDLSCHLFSGTQLVVLTKPFIEHMTNLERKNELDRKNNTAACITFFAHNKVFDNQKEIRKKICDMVLNSPK